MLIHLVWLILTQGKKLTVFVLKIENIFSLSMSLYRNYTVELNNSDSGDSPSTIGADKSNIRTKVCIST